MLPLFEDGCCQHAGCRVRLAALHGLPYARLLSETGLRARVVAALACSRQ